MDALKSIKGISRGKGIKGAKNVLFCILPDTHEFERKARLGPYVLQFPRKKLCSSSPSPLHSLDTDWPAENLDSRTFKEICPRCIVPGGFLASCLLLDCSDDLGAGMLSLRSMVGRPSDIGGGSGDGSRPASGGEAVSGRRTGCARHGHRIQWKAIVTRMKLGNGCGVPVSGRDLAAAATAIA